MSSISYIGIEFELPAGEEYLSLMVDADVFYANDSSYGSDADGNRGISVTEIEDIKITAIWDENGELIEDADEFITERATDAVIEHFNND